jgi:hypothetical protein
MSNASLRLNLQRLCSDYRSGDLALRELARQLEVHAEALEAFPSSHRDELKTLARRLTIQADYADEDCEYEPEVERLLGLLYECILRIPHVAA